MSNKYSSNLFHEVDEWTLQKIKETNRDVGFLIPIVNGEIWLGQRGTPPHEKMYGAIGGKTDAYEGIVCPFDALSNIIKMGGHSTLSVADRAALSSNKELPGETTLREFCEETFNAQVLYPGNELSKKIGSSRLVYPSDFRREDISDLKKLGTFDDKSSNEDPVMNHCYVYIARVNRSDFCLSPRELTDFKPITQIDPREIWLGTKIALTHLKYNLDLKQCGDWKRFGTRAIGKSVDELVEEHPHFSMAEILDMQMMGRYVELNLENQIPDFGPIAYRNTSMPGAINHYFDTGVLPGGFATLDFDK
ncbi:hypothetical protein HOA92_06230 [archaeon]|nr:hypothetical protein [archaeon]MBT6762608.1 hypothetical protein [archaeon]